MTAPTTEEPAYPDSIGFGFAEIAALASMRQNEASRASAEALRVAEYLANASFVAAGASSLVARGLATVEADGELSVAGPTAAVASALSSATRRMEIRLLTPESADSVIGVESPDVHLLLQPRAYLTWWIMAQRPDMSASEANFFIIKEHLHLHPNGGATIRRREEDSGLTLYIKRERESWTVGSSKPSQDTVAERTGLDDDSLLSEIRSLRQD